jgi:hypothetical protein
LNAVPAFNVALDSGDDANASDEAEEGERETTPLAIVARWSLSAANNP